MACPWSAFFRTFATSNPFDPTALPSHAQVVYETLLASFVDDIDAEKRSELQAVAAKARERAVMANPPPPPPPQQQELPLGWAAATSAGRAYFFHAAYLYLLLTTSCSPRGSTSAGRPPPEVQV